MSDWQQAALGLFQAMIDDLDSEIERLSLQRHALAAVTSSEHMGNLFRSLEAARLEAQPPLGDAVASALERYGPKLRIPAIHRWIAADYGIATTPEEIASTLGLDSRFATAGQGWWGLVETSPLDAQQDGRAQ